MNFSTLFIARRFCLTGSFVKAKLVFYGTSNSVTNALVFLNGFRLFVTVFISTTATHVTVSLGCHKSENYVFMTLESRDINLVFRVMWFNKLQLVVLTRYTRTHFVCRFLSHMAAHTSGLLLGRLHQRRARVLATLPKQTGASLRLAELTHRYVPA